MHPNKASAYDQESQACCKSERLLSQMLLLSIHKNQDIKYHKYT